MISTTTIIVTVVIMQILFALDVACYFKATYPARQRFMYVPIVGGFIALLACGKQSQRRG